MSVKRNILNLLKIIEQLTYLMIWKFILSNADLFVIVKIKLKQSFPDY